MSLLSRNTESTELRRWVDRGVENSDTMPGRYYTSELVYELECEYLFAKTWHIVGTVHQVAHVGDYFATEMLGEPLVVVRGNDDVVRCLSNVCRHRAAPVALGSGNKKLFNCPFHGWVYNLDGSGRSCAGMEGAQNFDPSQIQLPAFRTEVWGHWVFVALSDEAPPFTEWIATTDERAANYQVDELEYCGGRYWDVPANWKAYNDANHEAYHVPFLHPSLLYTYPQNQFGVLDQDVNWDGTAAADDGSYTRMTTSYGGEICVPEFDDPDDIDGNRVVAKLGSALDFRRVMEPLNTLEGHDRINHYFTFNWPGLSQFHFNPDGIVLLLTTPRAVDRTVVSMEYWMRPARNLEERLMQAALIVYGVQILDEDVAMIHLTGRGVRSRTYTAGRFAPLPENLLYDYNSWYAIQMQEAFDKAGVH